MNKIREKMFLLLLIIDSSFASRKQQSVKGVHEHEGTLNWHSESEPYSDFFDSFSWERNDDDNHSAKQQQSAKYTVKTKVSLTESELDEPYEQVETSKEQYSEYKPSKFKEYKKKSFYSLPITTIKPTTSVSTSKSPLVTRLPVLQLTKDLSYAPAKSVRFNTSHSSIQIPSISPFTSHLPKTEYQISIVHAPHAQSQAYLRNSLPTIVSYRTTAKPAVKQETSTASTTKSPKRTTKSPKRTTKSKKKIQKPIEMVVKQEVNEDVHEMDLQPLAAPKGDYGTRIARKKTRALIG